MSQNLLILQVNQSDYEDLLALAGLAMEADFIMEPEKRSRWTRIMEDLTTQVEQQQSGQFFQCAACHEDTPNKKL